MDPAQQNAPVARILAQIRALRSRVLAAPNVLTGLLPRSQPRRAHAPPHPHVAHGGGRPTSSGSTCRRNPDLQCGCNTARESLHVVKLPPSTQYIAQPNLRRAEPWRQPPKRRQKRRTRLGRSPGHIRAKGQHALVYRVPDIRPPVSKSGPLMKVAHWARGWDQARGVRRYAASREDYKVHRGSNLTTNCRVITNQ